VIAYLSVEQLLCRARRKCAQRIRDPPYSHGGPGSYTDRSPRARPESSSPSEVRTVAASEANAQSHGAQERGLY